MFQNEMLYATNILQRKMVVVPKCCYIQNRLSNRTRWEGRFIGTIGGIFAGVYGKASIILPSFCSNKLEIF